MTHPVPEHGVSRRRLLGYAGAGAAVGAAGFAGGMGTARATDGAAGEGIDRYAFHGRHQAGIVTPAQDRLHFAAFDVTATSRAELLLLLKAWTAAAAAMTQGLPVGGGTPLPYDAPAADTGEEEVWSHTDLYDFQANVDGARVAYEGLRPVLKVKNPALDGELEQRFAALQTLLDKYRTGSGDAAGFVSYEKLSDAEVKQLSDAVNALSEPLSRLTAAVTV